MPKTSWPCTPVCLRTSNKNDALLQGNAAHVEKPGFSFESKDGRFVCCGAAATGTVSTHALRNPQATRFLPNSQY